jgi:hypothetical protein
VLISSRLILSASSSIVPTHPNGYVHEFGHGVLGFCHVDGNAIGGPGLSIMSSGCCFGVTQQAPQPSPFDMAALQAVYASRLAIGANRDDFLLAGLVNPLPAAAERGTPAGTASHGSGRRVRNRVPRQTPSRGSPAPGSRAAPARSGGARARR